MSITWRRVLCIAGWNPFFLYWQKPHDCVYPALLTLVSVPPLVSDVHFLVRMLEHSFSCPVFCLSFLMFALPYSYNMSRQWIDPSHNCGHHHASYCMSMQQGVCLPTLEVTE